MTSVTSLHTDLHLEEETPLRLEPPRKSPVRRFLKPVLGGLAILLAAAAATAFWLNAQHYEETDDAQIEGHLNSISARISGTVIRINPDVQDDHYVEAGTLLVELDPNDYRVSLEHARAALKTRQATASAAAFHIPIIQASAFSQLALAKASESEANENVAAEEANLTAAQHRVEQDAAIYARAERDRQRYQGLVEKHEISRSDYDTRETEAKAAEQAWEADRANVVAAQKKIAQARNRVAEKQAEVEAARTAPDQLSDAKAQSASASGEVLESIADVHNAELNLGYTKIYAPVSGIIGRKTVEVGQRVQPGQGLLAIVPVDDIWVTADFKETQLKQMRRGQPVMVHVDAFGRDYRATVEEMPGAAGTLFSLLPPENASGNYVKVVQRLPVRIRIDRDQDPQHLLRPGMSVEPRVRVN